MDIKGYRVGQRVQADSARVRAKQTTPPPRFTDGTLIEAMTQIHKRVQDEAQRKMLMETNGLGTERTRSAILNTLVAKKFIAIRKQGKRNTVVSTETGRDLVDAVKQRTPEIADPVMTAKWEFALGMVESGQATLDEFMAKQEQYIRGMTQRVLGGQRITLSGTEQRAPRQRVEPLPGEGAPCPMCGKPLATKMGGKKSDKMKPGSDPRFLGCSGWPACNYIQRSEQVAA